MMWKIRYRKTSQNLGKEAEAMRIDKHTLYMNYPSSWWHDLWREGLICGNGEIGMNIYGGVKEETTMLTHHALWHNGKVDPLPDVSNAFAKLRKLMDTGEFREAGWEVVNALRESGYASRLESQLPAADLKLRIEPNVGFECYLRGIHMDTAEAECEWQDGQTWRASKGFVSRADGVAVKLLSSSSADLNVLISENMHRNQGSDLAETAAKHVVESKQLKFDEQFLCYSALNDDGTLFGAVAGVFPADGTREKTEQGIRVKRSSEILILASVFAGEAEVNREVVFRKEKERLQELAGRGYHSLLEAHAAKHRALYESADLSFHHRGKFHSNEELLMQAWKGTSSLELQEKLWRYGRYLFICGTAEQANPFPLYGLWGGEYDLIWSHNMANENTQMIYWHSYTGNLLPLQKGLYRYYNDRLPVFQENARKLFGMRGIYMTAGTTPGVSVPNQVVPVIMNWVSAAGWIAQHYVYYYYYTRDEAYLKEVLLPYLEQVAAFYEDYVEFYPDGSIHFYPSVSPENTPGNFMPPEHIQMAHPMPTTVNSTIDLAILKEFFTNLSEIARSHGLFADRLPKWERILKAIPEYRIGKDGGIREWQDDRFEERYDHRHLSHIYPVFPGHEVNSLHESELLPAFRRAVELRKIDAQTGWSLAHMAAIYARLEDGNAAFRCLNLMAKSCFTANFFSLHNDWRGMNLSLCMDPAPVQLDAVMGYTNAIQEMLIYSSKDLLKFLPALPDFLKEGRIRSFRYADGFVDMAWDVRKKILKAHIQALRPHTVVLQLPKWNNRFQFSFSGGRAKERQDGLVELELEESGKIDIF